MCPLIIIGLWAALIPTVKTSYDVSNTVLGGVLVAAIAGAILCLPVAAFGNNKIGSAKSAFAGAITLNCVMPISKTLHYDIIHDWSRHERHLLIF